MFGGVFWWKNHSLWNKKIPFKDILRDTLINLLTNFLKNLTGSQVDSNSARRELSIKPIYAIRYPSGYQDATKVSFCDSVTVHITGGHVLQMNRCLVRTVWEYNNTYDIAIRPFIIHKQICFGIIRLSVLLARARRRIAKMQPGGAGWTMQGGVLQSCIYY